MPTKPFSFSVLLVALTACGQTALPVDPPIVHDPPRAADGCTALFDAHADWSTGCQGPALRDGQREDLIAHCTARAELPGIAVAPAAFQYCAVKIATSNCASLPLECLTPADGSAQTTLTFLGGSVPEFYYEVFPRAPGSLPVGEGCLLGAQCQSGACSSELTCGICVDPKQIGEACGATSVCVNSDCQNGICVEIGVAAGGACQDVKGDSDCLSSLYCLDTVCVPRLKVGDTCPDDYRPVCMEGSLCLGSVCQAVEAVGEGEACDSTLARCTGEGLQCMEGTCRRPVDAVPAGGDCYLDTCALGLHCAAGTCVIPALSGAPCQEPASCVDGLTCLLTAGGTGQCAAPLGEGAECYSFYDCEGGLYCAFSKGPGHCQPLEPQGAPTSECAEDRPCGGAQVCRWGACVAIDSCSAP